MHQRGYITAIPNVREYISPYSSPYNERVGDNDNLNDLVDDIVAKHIEQEEEEEEEEEEVVEPLPPMTYQDALFALNTLRRFQEESKSSNIELLRHLRAFERDLNLKHQLSQHQVRLDRWFIEPERP